ncbi:MAG TPA: carboxypeptidase regulatory-like domain-containing protein [Vicinamibacterales bacterium]|nr:carboxypeptidase regulatory-like domain-containing protein [Vicinamibacterales bacterium]
MNRKARISMMAAALIIALGYARASTAQVFTGRIDVTVEDSTGGRLPGVNIDLTGPSNQSQVTDAQGQAHFLNLAVGTYTVKASLPGFNPKTADNIQVATGGAVELPIKMAVAGTQETVTVTAASPIIDTKKETTTTNITLDELQNIPTARDPWVVMQTVPSIYVDRVNVGGSESGQQSNYIGKGSVGSDNTWNIDGIPVTDMGATGSTPTYYDFDMFQEMAVTTGGADATVATPGVQLNMVLKKGTNIFHGDGNAYYENEKFQGNNLDPTLAQRIGGSTAACKDSGFTQHCGNRTDKYNDDGFDIGGPLLKDRLWVWGRLGRTDVRILTLTGVPDETILKNYAFKAEGQANASVRGNFTFFEGNKIKNGRGASATHPQETTWNQTGPTKMYKGEGNFVIGQSLFAAARYAYISGGFHLAPVGGLTNKVYEDDGLVWHGSYVDYSTTRPQYYAGGDASYFTGKHEVKFGFSWRKTPVDSLSDWPADRIVTIWNGYPDMYAQVTRDLPASTEGKYMNAFVTDTISFNRLTIQAGIRFDHATSSLLSTTVPGVSGFESLLPTLTAQGIGNAYDFNTVTPRAGITYALDDARKTVARASYAMFASQLPANAASFVSPIQYSYALYNAVDTNGNKVADPSEITSLAGTLGINTQDPSSISSANKITDNLKSPRTQEAMFGIDRELMANFGISATFTYRRETNILWNPPLGVTPSSYTQTGTFTGNFANVGPVSVPFYGVSASVDPTAGYIAQNRPDYHQQYLGFEVSATKRMSNHWMGRFGFSTNSWKEYFDGSSAILDRTPTAASSSQFNKFTAAGALQNGGTYVIQTSGSGKSQIYLVPPKYQLSANGMYEFRWGINVGANLLFREGYAEPFFRSRVNTSDALVPLKNVLIAPTADGTRLPNVTSLDARAEKAFKFGRSTLAVDLDVFNLFNNGTTLGLQYDARSTSYGLVQEVMQPRIARLGVRFMF